MPKRLGFPRNEASRRDRIAGREIFNSATRNIKSRNDAVADNPTASIGRSYALTGTAIAGGVLESEIVSGGETVIITLTGAVWHADIGSDNPITDALIAGITGNLSDAAGWNAEMSIAHGNIARTSDTVLTITLPAAGSYSITTGDETVTVDVPPFCVEKGYNMSTKSFVITEGS